MHNAHLVYPPCCHTTCFHQQTMVGVSSSCMCVVEHFVRVLWWWCWLCLQPAIISVDDAACCCEKRFMLFESLRDDIIRICPSEPFESCNDLLSMICAWDASVEKGSGIGTSLIQHLLLECTSSVFCLTQCMCPQSHSSGTCSVF